MGHACRSGVHFVAGRRFLDEIPVSDVILPLVVIDIRESVAADADCCLSLDDVLHLQSPSG